MSGTASLGADQPLQKLLTSMVDRKTFNVDLGFTTMPDEAFTAPRPPQNNGVQPRDRYCEARERDLHRTIATTSLALGETQLTPLGERDTLAQDHFVTYKGASQAAPFRERGETAEPIPGAGRLEPGAPSERARRQARARGASPQGGFSTTAGDAYSAPGSSEPLANSAAQRSQRAWERDRAYAVAEHRRELGRELRSRRLQDLRGSSISFAYSRPGEYYPEMVRRTPTNTSDPSRASEAFECGKRLDPHLGQQQIQLGGDYTLNDLAAERLHMQGRAGGEFKPQPRDYDIAAPLRHIDTSAHERYKGWSVTRTGAAEAALGGRSEPAGPAESSTKGPDGLHAPRPSAGQQGPSVSQFPPPTRASAGNGAWGQ